MSTTTINFTSKINGSLVDLDSIFLEDDNEDFGLRRVDNQDVVVVSGTVVPRLSLGTYAYTFTDPEPGLTYEYTLKITYNGVVYYYNRQQMSSSVQNLILIPSTDHYTSQAEVYRGMGSYAADLMIDDYAGEDKGYIWTDMLYDVDSTIQMYIGQHYNPSTLYSNQWIRRRATILAIYNLSCRRGNAPIFVGRADRVYDELNAIRDNRFHIPNGVPRAFQGPVVRNYEMQNILSSRHPVRVQTTKSTGHTYSNEDAAWEPFIFGYLL